MLLWLAFVIIAVILAVANLILSVIGRPRLRNWLTIGSLSFTALEAWADEIYLYQIYKEESP